MAKIAEMKPVLLKVTDKTPLFYGLGIQDVPSIENGWITVPNSPGLGFELDDAVVQQYGESIQS
jgi:L-alanine-DL-glutamate epimerase-like enolase superfamily enzyme